MFVHSTSKDLDNPYRLHRARGGAPPQLRGGLSKPTCFTCFLSPLHKNTGGIFTCVPFCLLRGRGWQAKREAVPRMGAKPLGNSKLPKLTFVHSPANASPISFSYSWFFLQKEGFSSPFAQSLGSRRRMLHSFTPFTRLHSLTLRLQRSYFLDPILFFRSDLIFGLPCKREN